MTRLLRLAAAAAAAVIAIAACSSGDDDTPGAAGTTAAPSATSAPATGTSAPGGGEGTSSSSTEGGSITIKDFKYGEPLTVAPGAVIEVENEDTAGHDVVSDDGKFKTPVLGKGETATFTAPTEPGTYKFSCSLHPASMSGIGTLIVQG